MAVIGFVAGLGGVAVAQLWQAGRSRREQQWQRDSGRQARLRPSLEPLLHAAVRLERYLSAWSPTWPLALTAERRDRAGALFDDLDESAEIAEMMLRLDGAPEVVQRLRDLRARIARFHVAIAALPANAAGAAAPEEVGAAAAAITASLPDLKAVLLAQLDVPQLRPVEPAAAPAGAARLAWPASLDPLRHAVFRWLWLAALASQLGTWVQNVGAVDLMTAVAPTALLLALVQTAMTLPGLLLALPAGALADILDRRRLLLAASVWMVAVSALLAATTFAHLTAWWLLLALTFALGAGTVAGLPAWQAIIPDLVPRDGLAPAVTLSSLAINLARVTGPAIGGLAVALAGPGAAFALTAASFVFTALVVAGWRRDGQSAALPSEGVLAAIRSGVRYSLGTARVRAILVRAVGFIGASSALWALLPVVSRRFGQGSTGYSLLLGSLGVGAVVGVLLLSSIRRALRPGALVVVASAVFAAATLGVALAPVYWAALVLMLGAGGAWVSALSTFNVAVQHAAPRWVRGRVLASYQVAYMGSLAIGSAAWGAAASRLGAATAMELAAGLLAASLLLALPWRLHATEGAAAEVGEDRPVPTTEPAPAWPPAAVAPATGSGIAIAAVGASRALAVPAAAGGRDGADLTGRRLGAYRLESPAGTGAAGPVYRASDAAGASWAVEVVGTDPVQLDGFLTGARCAIALRHPNILGLVDCGAEDGLGFLVTEDAESVTLAEHLARLAAPAAVADPAVRRCVREVALALDYAHACGMAHGDVRPANVLIRLGDGRALLRGFAALPAGSGSALARAARPLAAYASVAPEQWAPGVPAAAPGDVYSFAAMLFEIATGAPPAGRVLAGIAGHPDRLLPPLGLAVPQLPEALDAVLTRGLATSPQARPRTAGDLAAAYLGATETSLPVLAGPVLPVPARPAALATRSAAAPRRRGRTWPAAVAVLGSAALLGVTVATRTPAPAAGPLALPAAETGSVGAAMAVASAELTVQDVLTDAAAPAPAGIGPGDRVVAVQVRYRAGEGAPAIVSPYEWVLTDDSGGTYTTLPDDAAGALPERQLAAGRSMTGRIGFVVPRDARGLVLHYDDQTSYESAEVPLP